MRYRFKITALCFLTINLLCNAPITHAEPYVRIYPGEPLPVDQVAFVKTSGISGIYIEKIYNISFSGGFWKGHVVGGELLPGNYDFCIGYYSKVYNTIQSIKKCIPVQVHLRPGHIYCFLPDLRYEHFSPVFWDITLEGERRKIEEALKLKIGTLNEDIGKVNEYFKGKRAEVKFAREVSIAKELLENQITGINQVWSQIKPGNVLEISFQDKIEVIVVEKVKEDFLIYNDIKEPDISFSIKKSQIKKMIILAESVETYKKTITQ